MISDARGGHVSPGIYTEIRDVTYSTKSLGITTLGVAGETLKGPAFQPISIASWTDFVDYFGGTSPIKYKGTDYPKYELPYVAKAYLEESKQLEVVRVLGLSGYWAGRAWIVKAEGTNRIPVTYWTWTDLEGNEVSGYTEPTEEMMMTGTTAASAITYIVQSIPVVILRSKKDYTPVKGTVGICEQSAEGPEDIVSSIVLGPYTGHVYGANCEINGEEEQVAAEATSTIEGSDISVDLGKFALTVTYTGGTVTYNVSMNPADPDYIYKMFPEDPLMGTAPIYIEAVYDMALYKSLYDEAATSYTYSCVMSQNYYDYISTYRCAVTPWIVSEVKAASTKAINLKKLFKVYTISDGNAANYQVKISIQKIRPKEGLFDVIVRDFYDTDNSQIVLERFNNCSMVEGEASFIGLKIGTIDGSYPNKSKYIAVELSNEEGVDDCVPCGFLGYPVPKYETAGLEMNYNCMYDNTIKPKRQYFGLNNEVLDYDVLNYKGVDAYNDALGDADPSRLTNGFHLDAIFDPECTEMKDAQILVDGETGFTFTSVKAVQTTPYERIPRIIPTDYLDLCLYKDINLRKFTVYPYGGFDGWDINRDHRTNTNEYRGNKYTISSTTKSFDNREIFRPINGEYELELDPQISLKLPNIAITTDYYAYLAGYMQFANPEDVDINLFATPGINWYDQSLLSEDALDVIEDTEDGRGGDALYIMAAPQFDVETKDSYGPEDVAVFLEDTELDSPYACTYWPWVKYYDGDAKRYVDLPVTKDVVRDMAATDNVSFPWFSPAGLTRGEVDCTRAYYKTTLLDEDTLYENMINPIKTFAVDGVKVWGNKTLYHQETPRNRINVSRLMIRVKKLISQAARNLIFEQYDVTLEKQFRSVVEPILQDVKANRGIYDYRVVTESTEETRDQHILPAKILIKPTPALEYISISFVVYPESVQFDNDL